MNKIEKTDTFGDYNQRNYAFSRCVDGLATKMRKRQEKRKIEQRKQLIRHNKARNHLFNTIV